MEIVIFISFISINVSILLLCTRIDLLRKEILNTKHGETNAD